MFFVSLFLGNFSSIRKENLCRYIRNISHSRKSIRRCSSKSQCNDCQTRRTLRQHHWSAFIKLAWQTKSNHSLLGIDLRFATCSIASKSFNSSSRFGILYDAPLAKLFDINGKALLRSQSSKVSSSNASIDVSTWSNHCISCIASGSSFFSTYLFDIHSFRSYTSSNGIGNVSIDSLRSICICNCSLDRNWTKYVARELYTS